MLTITEARKRFGSVTAVDAVSFSAQDGAITGLLGPNGAGKTTTLRMLYAVMKPDSGEVRVDDVDAVAAPQAAQARLGVLPDGFGLYPRLTTREHLDYFGALHGIDGARLAKRTTELLDLLDMHGIADRRTGGFSHGERMKVALARALVHDPQNVLLDEPTNGLDVMSTRAVRAIVRRLRDEGRCVLFSSHVMHEVSALCDSIVVIASGRVVARGTPDELRRQTGCESLEDAFVALAGLEREDRPVILARTIRQAATVCRKELIDSMRDRRALWSIAFSVLVGPVLVAFMVNRIADRQRDADDVRLPIVGASRAPALVEWLKQQSGVTVVEGPADAEEAVRDQREAVVVIVPEDFAERFRESRPAPLQVVADSSRTDVQPAVQRVQSLLQQYAAEISGLRLIMRGVSPAAMRPIAIEQIEVSTAQQRAAQILTFIPMFIMIAGFVGGMQIATDSTAGERERGSLEPLLVNPAPRSALAGGKWLAATIAAIVSVCLTTLLCAVLTWLLPLEDIGLRLRIGPEHVGPILLAAAPLCLFTAALQAAVATLARSFKEAQTYMGVLILAPMLPGIMSALYPLGRSAWMYAVPMLGPYVLLTEVLGGRVPEATSFLVSSGTCLLASAILVQITTGLFRSERIIFGR